MFNLILNPLIVIIVNIIILTKQSVSLLKAFVSSIIIVITVIIGARLTHVIIAWGYYRDFSVNPFSLSPSGFAMYGGFISALPILYLLSRFTKKSFFRFLDYITPGWAIGIFFNKIGCFLNGCCFGIPTSSFIGVRYPEGSSPYNFYYNKLLAEAPIDIVTLSSISIHPVQLYEAIIGIFCFVIAIYLINKHYKAGIACFITVAIYAFSRIVFHFLRAFPSSTTMNYYLILFFYIIVFLFTLFMLIKTNNQKT
jgi:phosphatidylglycerol:prolipoprotein diacylglycerol transferase